jgi:hypothetical protein
MRRQLYGLICGLLAGASAAAGAETELTGHVLDRAVRDRDQAGIHGAQISVVALIDGRPVPICGDAEHLTDPNGRYAFTCDLTSVPIDVEATAEGYSVGAAKKVAMKEGTTEVPVIRLYRTQLPAGASPLALVGVAGVLALAGALAVRSVRRAA